MYSATLSTIVAASLDGDRVVTGDSGISSPRALSYDATDGTWTRPSAFDVYSVTLDRSGTRIGAAGTVYDGAFASLGSTANWRMTVSPSGARAYVYYPATPPQLQTYDISGPTVTQVSSGSFPTDPGSTGNASNLPLTSLDGGTLFVDGSNGILVMPAP